MLNGTIPNTAGITRLRIGVTDNNGKRAELNFIAAGTTAPLVAVISGIETDGSDDAPPTERDLDDQTKKFYLYSTDAEELCLTVFYNLPESAEPVAENPAADVDAVLLTPSLKSAIQKRLDARAAERRAAEIEKAKADAARRDREARGREFFIAELEQREGVILHTSQVVVEEEPNRTVYNISVPLSETTIIWFRGNMYNNNKMEFAFSSWDAGHGNWLFNGDYYPTLADAVIATLETDVDLDTLFE